MKKVMIIVAVALVIVGAVICAAAAASMKFDFRKLDSGDYEMNTYAVKDDFSSISVEASTEKIRFVPSDDGKCKVVCLEDENTEHEVTVSGGTLVIKEIDKRKWGVSFGFHTRTPETTVYLPEGGYDELLINADTGDISIPAGFSFENMDIRSDTSDVECFASADELLSIQITTGDVTIEDISAGGLKIRTTTGHIDAASVRCDGDILTEVDTGKTNLKDITCRSLVSKGTTGDLNMKNVVASGDFNITRTTGDVEFDACDAFEISVKTDTGDVTGTLLSEKTFFAESDTGKVSVPKSVTGGRCEISTDTGKIVITVK